MIGNKVCEDCLYYMGIDEQANLERHGIKRGEYGTCQRNPPQVFFVKPGQQIIEKGYDPKASDPFDPGFHSKWPIVDMHDGCGEHTYRDPDCENETA